MYLHVNQTREHLKSSISFICIGCKLQTFNPVSMNGSVMYLLQPASFENVFPINSNSVYKKRFLQEVNRWIWPFYNNIDLCGGHLHFLRGMNMQFSVISTRMHFFHILTAPFALIIVK